MPAASRAATFSGLLVMRRTAWTPRSLRISAGSSNSRWSASVAERVVGFDGVEALVLELVGAELGHEADAAAFLLLVEQDAGAFVGDAGEREVELVVAVAAQGVEDVAGEALRVDADDGRRGVDVAEDEGDGGLDALLRAGSSAWRAVCSRMPSKPRMRKCAQRVGKSASATLRMLSKGITAL